MRPRHLTRGMYKSEANLNFVGRGDAWNIFAHRSGARSPELRAQQNSSSLLTTKKKMYSTSQNLVFLLM